MTPGQQIVQKLGIKHTTPCVITIKGKAYMGVYTFEGEVFCLIDGHDVPLEECRPDEQNEILDKIMTGEYNLDPSFQG